MRILVYVFLNALLIPSRFLFRNYTMHNDNSSLPNLISGLTIQPILKVSKLYLRNNPRPLLGNDFIFFPQRPQQSFPAGNDVLLPIPDKVQLELSEAIRQRRQLRARQRHKRV